MNVSDKFVTINGIKLHCIEEGKGQIIIFLHGFPDSSDTWNYQIKYFSKNITL